MANRAWLRLALLYAFVVAPISQTTKHSITDIGFSASI